MTTFSSHIHRVQQVLEAAYLDGRVVALVGRSLTRNVNIATNLVDPDTGRPYLTLPPGTSSPCGSSSRGRSTSRSSSAPAARASRWPP